MDFRDKKLVIIQSSFYRSCMQSRYVILIASKNNVFGYLQWSANNDNKISSLTFDETT